MSDLEMSTDDRLIYMANQIARNFAVLSETAAAEATAEHMLSFWDPRMKEKIAALLVERPSHFTPAAAIAVEHIRRNPRRPSSAPQASRAEA